MLKETSNVKESPEASEARVLAFRDSLAYFLNNLDLSKRAVETYLSAESGAEWLPLIQPTDVNKNCSLSLSTVDRKVIQIREPDGKVNYYRLSSKYNVTENVPPPLMFTLRRQDEIKRREKLENLAGVHRLDIKDPIKELLFVQLGSYSSTGGARLLPYGHQVPTLEESLVDNATTLFSEFSNVALRDGIINSINLASTKSWRTALTQNKI